MRRLINNIPVSFWRQVSNGRAANVGQESIMPCDRMRTFCSSLNGLSIVQVVLYLLLMEERYGVQMERGLLQYLSDKLPEVGSKH